MAKMTIKLDIDTSVAADLELLNLITSAVNGSEGFITKERLDTADGYAALKEAAKRAYIASQEELAAEEEAAAKKAEEVKQMQELEEAKHQERASEYTLADVRKAVASKVKTHREEIKAKIKDLGEEGVPSMKVENYEPLINFINSL